MDTDALNVNFKGPTLTEDLSKNDSTPGGGKPKWWTSLTSSCHSVAAVTVGSACLLIVVVCCCDLRENYSCRLYGDYINRGGL
jgi:hypothetical protein